MPESLRNVINAATHFKRPNKQKLALKNIEVDEDTRKRLTARDLIALDDMLAGQPGSRYTLKRVD